jgi:hypothetical protein
VVEEWPNNNNPGYEVTYSLGDGPASVDESSHTIDPSGGVITVTNRDTKAEVKVRKQFVDSSGNQINPATVSASPTFTLKRYKRTVKGPYTVNLYTANDTDSAYKSLNCKEGDIVDVYWNAVESHKNDTFTIYPDSGRTSNDNLALANGGNYDWDDSETGIKARLKIESGSVKLLNKNSLSEGSDVTAFTSTTKNLYMDQPLSGDGSLEEKTTDGTVHMVNAPIEDTNFTGQSRQLTLPSFDSIWTKDGNWLTASFDKAPVISEDGTESYTYYVEESGLSSDYEVSYSVDGEIVDPGSPSNWLTRSGTVEVTNKDKKKTSVSVVKQWHDAANNDTTLYHESLGHSAQLTLYRVTTRKSGNHVPEQVEVNNDSMLVLPSGIDKQTAKVPDEDGITNPITLKGNGTATQGLESWSYTWSGLPAEDNDN